MKKILSLAIIMVIVFGLNAQKQFQLGLQVSNKLTWLNTAEKSVITDGIRYGGGVQFMFDYNITENYVFSSGIGLMGIGGKIQYVDSLPYFETRDSIYGIPPYSVITNKIEAFTIPLTIKLRTNDIGKLRIYGRLGVNTHIRSKAKGDINIVNQQQVNFLEGENITNEVSMFVLSSPIMAGIEYALWEETRLIAEIGYDHGWTNVSRQIKSSDGKISDKRRNVTIGYLSLNVGILF